jgi:hypothetical protein
VRRLLGVAFVAVAFDVVGQGLVGGIGAVHCGLVGCARRQFPFLRRRFGGGSAVG